jgi:hypothetical protein
MVVVMKFSAPRSDEKMIRSIPTSHKVWPWPGAVADSGGYDVHPLFAAPPGDKKADQHDDAARNPTSRKNRLVNPSSRP